MKTTERKRTYTFSGNDREGRMRTIEVESVSPVAADRAAKQRLKNARMTGIR